MSGSDPSSSGIPQLGDPFSAAASQNTAPGFLGQSPAFWQHLAQFGGNLSQAANARTGSGHLANGTGFAGPFGAAIGQTAQDAQGQALAQARIGQSRAETTGINQQNQLRNIQMPAEIMRAQFQTQALQDPGLRSQLGYGSGDYTAPPQSQQPQSGGGQQPPYEQGVLRNESGGSMAPGMTGDGGQAHGPMQIHPAALQDVNSKFGTNLTPQQTTQYPELGKWAGDRYLEIQQQRFGPVGGVAAYNAGPGAMQNAIDGKAPLPLSTVQYTQRAIGIPQTQGQAQPQPQGQPQGQPQPQPQSRPTGGPGDSLLQQADTLTARANRIAQAQAIGKMAGVPVGPGMAMDPTALHTQAQQLREQGLRLNAAGPEASASEAAKLQQQLQYGARIAGNNKLAEGQAEALTAGAITAEKSRNSNIDLRPGGMAWHVTGPNGQGEWIKNPQLEETQDPATGQKTYTHISPALPGSAPGTSGTSDPVLGPDGQPVVKSIAPNVQDARNKAFTDFAGKDTDTFHAATNTQGVLAQMNEAARTLNQTGGMLGTGPTAPARIAFAAKVNDIMRTAGLKGAFDPNAIGSWEELAKATQTAGFELASHYEGHARQAASTIENATAAVPGEKNSPVGFAKVYAGINEQAQLGMDLHNAKLPAYQSGGDIVSAETNFINQFPAQMYSRRAISTVTPYPISSDKELGLYLPGTFVVYKGNIVPVPPRPGAPPIPDYIKEMHQPQPGQAPSSPGP